jgi:hypothetical protein
MEEPFSRPTARRHPGRVQWASFCNPDLPPYRSRVPRPGTQLPVT